MTDIRPLCSEIDELFKANPAFPFEAARAAYLLIGESTPANSDARARAKLCAHTHYTQALKRPIVYEIRLSGALDPIIDWFVSPPGSDVERKAEEACAAAGVSYWGEDVYVVAKSQPDKPLIKSHFAPDMRVGYEYEDAPSFFGERWEED